jgi:hypothetical protein
MSHGASICSYRYNPPPAPEVLHGIFGEQGRQPDTIINPAPSQREMETQLVMDRLLREYLSPRSRRE